MRIKLSEGRARMCSLDKLDEKKVRFIVASGRQYYNLEKQFIFMADSWRPESLADSRYIWLPVRFDEKGIPFIEWVDRWKPD